MASDLREDIERRMLAAVDKRLYFGSLLIEHVVSVCEAMIREERERWGHIAGCKCHQTEGEFGIWFAAGPSDSASHYCDCEPHPYRDPHCSPQEAPDAAPSK